MKRLASTDQPLYARIAGALEELIQAGALRPGERVPSIRRASRQHGVSANTVVEAYLALENRGLIEGRPKSGFFVRARRAPSPRKSPAPFRQLRSAPVSVASLQSRIFDAARSPDVVPFGAAYPGADVLPAEKLARITAVLARSQSARAISYDMPPGNDALRREIAKRALDGGATLAPDEIITTCGATEALGLALRAVTKPGDVVAIESPTYFGILQLLEDLRLRALEVPTDPVNGIDLAALQKSVRAERIAAVVCVPNHSNPLGAVMPDGAKEELATLLRKREIPLVEDDVNGELTHAAARCKTTHSFDRDGWILLCGSYSKTLAPGYRVGWIAPGRFYERVKTLKLTTTLATPSLTQMAVAEFLANGGYDHHLRSLRALFAEQLQRSREIVLRSFPAGTRVTNPTGGFVLWVELPPGSSALQVHERALAAGISVAPGDMFSPARRYTRCLRINCGHSPSPAYDSALEQLGSIAAQGR
jgi:DNA-binding transcriptional MocR family regulator